MARTESSSTEAAGSSSSSALPSSASNNNHNASSDPSRPPLGVVMAPASASAAAAAASSSSSSMSISDLVPLSMSVLRDKMMTDMNTEHEALKMKMQHQEEDRLRVAITGPNSDRVYFEKSIRDGVSGTERSGKSFWAVIFDDNDDNNTNTIIPNFIETVAGLEIRLGDIVVFPFNTAKIWTAPAEDAGFDRTRNDTPQMGYVIFNNANGVIVRCRVGPILYEDYINLPTGTSVPGLVRFLRNHQTSNNDTVLLPQLEVERVAFLKSRIPGIVPLLEEDTTGGLSTSE